MQLKQPTRSTLVDQVVAQIESLIESGTWAVGSRIPVEPELADQLGVSRNTVREAVRALIHAGLLIARQGDGTYVSSSSSLGAILKRRLLRSNMTETLEVRYALEQEAARLAALRCDAVDARILRECLDICKRAAMAKDVEAYIEADLKLHKSIVAATRNSVLNDLYNHLTEAMQIIIGDTADFQTLSNPCALAHETLVEAILSGNPSAAADAARKVIENAQEAWQRLENKESHHGNRTESQL